MNGDGLLAEVPRDAHDTIPHFLKATVCTPDDWKRVKAERFRPEGRVIDVEALKKAHPADRDYPLGVDVGSMIGTIRDMLTFEGLCYAMYDYPAMVEDMVETCCVLVEQTLDQLLPHFDFDFASGWEDICFKNGPIVTPAFFRDVVMPRYKRIHQKLKAHGLSLIRIWCEPSPPGGCPRPPGRGPPPWSSRAAGRPPPGPFPRWCRCPPAGGAAPRAPGPPGRSPPPAGRW